MAMDWKHERGELDEPCDEWTYNVWRAEGV